MMPVAHMSLVFLQALLLPLIYAAVKIVAGVLVLKYGKRYADRVKAEEEA